MLSRHRGFLHLMKVPGELYLGLRLAQSCKAREILKSVLGNEKPGPRDIQGRVCISIWVFDAT